MWVRVVLVLLAAATLAAVAAPTTRARFRIGMLDKSSPAT